LPIRIIFLHEKKEFCFFSRIYSGQGIITIEKGGVRVGKKMFHLLVIILLMAAGNIYTSAKTKADSEKGIINSNGIHIRKGPGLNYSVSQTASKGETFAILERKNGWVKVKRGESTGWLAEWLVNSAAKRSSSNLGSNATVTVDQLRVRETPNLQSNILTSLNQNQQVTVLTENGDWAQIQTNGMTGWVSKEFLDVQSDSKTNDPNTASFGKNGSVTILYNGTNLRAEPSVQSSIAARANAGEAFPMEGENRQWYKVKLPDGSSAYVASWIVSTSKQMDSSQPDKGIKGKTIVIDPGHGGSDNGTTGVSGTLEKLMTLKTAELLSSKLKSEGANVILTRNSDEYVSLDARVAISVLNDADAFIAIHFDSDSNASVSGHTTYYYHRNQMKLAEAIDQGISANVLIPDRGVRFGDFHVIRENPQPAVLLELGYLSNSGDEKTVNTGQYQESVTNGILDGVTQYFK
jgi:N-acetylmuramoyl-L-alanine amidase